MILFGSLNTILTVRVLVGVVAGVRNGRALVISVVILFYFWNEFVCEFECYLNCSRGHVSSFGSVWGSDCRDIENEC